MIDECSQSLFFARVARLIVRQARRSGSPPSRSALRTLLHAEEQVRRLADPDAQTFCNEHLIRGSFREPCAADNAVRQSEKED